MKKDRWMMRGVEKIQRRIYIYEHKTLIGLLLLTQLYSRASAANTTALTPLTSTYSNQSANLFSTLSLAPILATLRGAALRWHDHIAFSTPQDFQAGMKKNVEVWIASRVLHKFLKGFHPNSKSGTNAASWLWLRNISRDLAYTCGDYPRLSCLLTESVRNCE